MLLIKREQNEIDSQELYHVYINQIDMGTIANGEDKNFPLKDGEYALILKSKEKSSQSIKFIMEKGKIVEFFCKPNYGNSFFSKFLYRIFFRGRAIHLSLKQDIYL